MVIGTVVKKTSKRMFTKLQDSLNTEIVNFCEWSSNNLKINTHKTCYQLFTLISKIEDLHLKINNTKVR